MKGVRLQVGLTRPLASMAIGVCLLMGMGCAEKAGRLNAPPQGSTEQPSDLQDNYIAMTDNALLADMSVSTVHFVPHTSELNGSGVRRLKRYASIMKVYGGTLNYDGAERDESLVTCRIQRVKDYLIAEGLEAGCFDVQRGMAGGSGMPASEAIEVRKSLVYKSKTSK